MASEHDHDLPDTRAEDRLWRRWVFIATGSFVVASLLLGAILLPIRDNPQLDPWGAICRAFGFGTNVAGTAAKPGSAASDVTWSAATRIALEKGDPKRGFDIVKDNCSACHGEKGLSIDPTQFPNLAGQSEAALFKQLSDFKSGSRVSDIMGPVAQALTDQQIEDISAYFAGQKPAPASDKAPEATLDLVNIGNPALALPPCIACHNDVGGGPEGAPLLSGQSPSYLEAQLKKFASGERHNDTFARMRSIAKDLTAEQMHALAQYYGMPSEAK
ncbi:c-type cytochrome [Hyphomicrobium sp. 802]|uniref:c-type cytochrome n=1 Tax=Hyphomicrobium sp. 802 TaxID=1112272 RepID=UPI00045E5F44|nr:c-type cytochrome [Hyphomicrobium sp. 802]